MAVTTKSYADFCGINNPCKKVRCILSETASNYNVWSITSQSENCALSPSDLSHQNSFVRAPVGYFYTGIGAYATIKGELSESGWRSAYHFTNGGVLYQMFRRLSPEMKF